MGQSRCAFDLFSHIGINLAHNVVPELVTEGYFLIKDVSEVACPVESDLKLVLIGEGLGDLAWVLEGELEPE